MELLEIKESHCTNHVYGMDGCKDCDAQEFVDATPLLKSPMLGIHEIKIDPGHPSPKLQLVKSQLARKIYIFLTNTSADVVKAVKSKGKEFEKAHKADDTDDKQKEQDQLIYAATSAIIWVTLANEIIEDLNEAAQMGRVDGYSQLNLTPNYDTIKTESLAYAKARAAEMIGKKWEDGKLVDDATAKYVIAETTNDDIHDVIEEAVLEDQSIEKIAEMIQAAGMFSKARSELIAKTELAFAQSKGNIEVWKSSGLVKSVKVVKSHIHVVEDVCDEVEAAGPYLIHKAPEIPIHPQCRCALEVHELEKSL